VDCVAEAEAEDAMRAVGTYQERLEFLG
jgi:hypothetical protein